MSLRKGSESTWWLVGLESAIVIRVAWRTLAVGPQVRFVHVRTGGVMCTVTAGRRKPARKVTGVMLRCARHPVGPQLSRDIPG